MSYGQRRREFRPMEIEYPTSFAATDALYSSVAASLSSAHQIAWSPDGKFVALAVNASPYVWVFRVVDGVLVKKMPDPAVAASGDAYEVKWSPSGNYIAVAGQTSPYVSVWAWSTAGFGTKVSAPATPPTGTGRCVIWHPSETYVFIGHDSSPFITGYPWSAGFGTKLADPAALPASNVNDGVCLTDGTSVCLVIAPSSTPYMESYPFTTTYGTKAAGSAAAAAGNTLVGLVNGDHGHVIISSGSSPYIQDYAVQLSNGAFNGPSSPPTTPDGPGPFVLDPLTRSGAHFTGMSGSASTMKLGTWLHQRSSTNRVSRGFGSVAIPGGANPVQAAISPDRRYLLTAQYRNPMLRMFSWDNEGAI